MHYIYIYIYIVHVTIRACVRACVRFINAYVWMHRSKDALKRMCIVVCAVIKANAWEHWHVFTHALTCLHSSMCMYCTYVIELCPCINAMVCMHYMYIYLFIYCACYYSSVRACVRFMNVYVWMHRSKDASKRMCIVVCAGIKANAWEHWHVFKHALTRLHSSMCMYCTYEEKYVHALMRMYKYIWYVCMVCMHYIYIYIYIYIHLLCMLLFERACVCAFHECVCLNA